MNELPHTSESRPGALKTASPRLDAMAQGQRGLRLGTIGGWLADVAVDVAVRPVGLRTQQVYELRTRGLEFQPSLRPWFAALFGLLVASFMVSAAQFGPPIVLESPEPEREGWFGMADVSSVTDVSGDGRADILICAVGELGGGASAVGRVYLFDGVSRELLRELRSPNEAFDGHLGNSALGIGDVNGDNRGDVVVGTDIGENRVYVFDGATGQVIHTLEPGGAPRSLSGVPRQISSLPDVSRDGRPDIVIGLQDFGGGNSSGVKIYDGASGTVLRTISGTGLGSVVSGIPDVNGDGRGDVIAGALLDDRAYIYDGATGALLHTLRGSGRFGRSVAGLRDINGDGRGDVVVGANQLRRAYIYDGATGKLLHTLRGPGDPTAFGWMVNALPDINGDGWDDVAVPTASRARANAYVFSGRTGELLATLPGHSYEYGRSVAGVLDVNGDGLGEVLVANQYGNSTSGVYQAGQVFLYLSKASLKPPEPTIMSWSAEGFKLRLTGQAGVKFELQRSDDLINWSLIATQTHTGGATEFLDLEAKSASRRFYRTRSTP